MKRARIALVFGSLVILAALAAQAGVSDAAIKAQVGICSAEPTITREALPQPLPRGFTGEMIIVKAESGNCGGQYVAATSPSGEYYVGLPWLLKDLDGTPAERIRTFAWQMLHESFTPVIASVPSRNGLLKVTLNEKTEYGDLPMEGWVDPGGMVFFPGDFHKSSEDPAHGRLDKLQPVLALAPTRGPKDAQVTLIEFSDFECPSCKRATTFLKPLLEKYGDKIRYIRVDLPLTSAHPWAFPAALAGRAIYRQSPDAFWKFKEWIYDAQAELSVFALEDYARNFVKDNGLDVARYDRDVSSEALRKEILTSAGTAFSLQIMGTPTYLVNGVAVEAGVDGKTLDGYLAKLLGAK